MPITSINPATGEEIQSYDELSEKELKDKISLSQKAFNSWKTSDFTKRSESMLKVAQILEENSAKYADIITKEMGKPITQSQSEVEKCAWCCRYYAENAQQMLAPEYIETDASESFVAFEPLGPILAVMPWNFPFWQVIRFAAPALMAGNTGLLKHASITPQCAIELEKLFLEANFPEGAFQALLIPSSMVEGVIQNDKVRAVTLTGSEPAGSAVASQAGKEIKKTVMELGGSDPFIVLEDADLDYTCEVAVKARHQNTGQSCIAAKRFIIVEPLYEEFIKKYKERVESIKVGDPMDSETELGPLANQQLIETLEDQIRRSTEMGAQVVTGGNRINRPGYFYQPTILSDVTQNMPVFKEETFGPVSAVIKASSNEDAIAIANDSRFGLGASLWTQDLELAKRVAAKIESGSIFINGMVKSDPRLPFGGIKKSGYGRELGSFGIREFVNIKTIWIK